jgi:phosphoenolpyruvate carboxykinase (ATP)
VKDPQATFSTCFGAPFMPRAPKVYAEMLGQRMRQHGAQCWLVNTGWYGGPYGTGQRMSLPYTRQMVRAAIDGKLDDLEFVRETAFGLMIPKHIEGIPERLLNPRNAWADKQAYDKKAAELAERFARNFERFDAPAEVCAAGPIAVTK